MSLVFFKNLNNRIFFGVKTIFESVVSALRNSIFALRTRSAHLLLDCLLDTLRCAYSASRLCPVYHSYFLFIPHLHRASHLIAMGAQWMLKGC